MTTSEEVKAAEKAYLEACARADRAFAYATKAFSRAEIAWLNAKMVANKAYNKAIKESDGKNKRN